MNANASSIAIVGGGIAGMSAALALRSHCPDLAITLFEAKRLTGGRAGSFVDSTTIEPVDYCQHVAMGCCTNLLAMMQHAEIHDAFTRYKALTFHHRDHAPVHFGKTRFLPAPLHLAPSLLRMSYLTWRQRTEVTLATGALMRTKPESLKSTTANDWLIRHHQSANTIRDYWEVVIASALGESSERVSMAAARKVFIDGFLAHPDASDVLVPRLPLAELFGEALPRALEQKNIRVHRSSPIQSVTRTEANKMNLRISGKSVEFDHVILAVPSSAIHKVLSRETAIQAGLPEDRFQNVPSSPITGIHLWFDRPVLNAPHAVLVDTLAQWVFRRDSSSASVGQPSGQHYIQVVISASHRVRQSDSEQVIRQVVDEIKQIFPEAHDAKLLRGRVVTDPQSVFSLSPAVDAIRPASRTALPCLHLAGDFVQTGWPATMEGAVISGRMAASSVAEQQGIKPINEEPGLARNLLCRLLIR
jgi:squalene-associated FAD-dependent desaturase